MVAMHHTGGQPGRGKEIGSIKYRNSGTSIRNLFMHRGDLLYVTEYHKARSATNLSHVVARFLPEPVAQLVLIFIAFIRPFCNMIYNQIAAFPNKMDGDYLFSDETRPDQPWDGRHLTRALQQVSNRYLRVSLSVWIYRHFAVAVTRKYVKEIAVFFAFGDEDWEKQFEKERGMDVYAWQTGHLRGTNNGHYGLDVAYPSKLQPELLDEYRRISRRWQEWLGFRKREVVVMSVVREQPVTPKKRTREDEDNNGMVDPNISPESQRLKKMAKDLDRLMELRREERKLREKYHM
jgi:hypothetical protein